MNAMALLEALSCGNPSCPCAAAIRKGRGQVHCPSHDDRRPSLSVQPGRTVPVLVHCQSHCDQEHVIEALKQRKLWAGAPTNGASPTRETRWEIRDATGVLAGIHVRTDPGKKFRWEMADGSAWNLDERPVTSLPLYNAHRVPSWAQTWELVLCEGEGAADALWKLRGVPALATVTGASKTPDAKSLSVLAGHGVYLWPDSDDPGAEHMARVGAGLASLGIYWRVIGWPDAKAHDDAKDFITAGGDRLAIEKLMEDAGCSHRPPQDGMTIVIPRPLDHYCSCCGQLTRDVDYDDASGSLRSLPWAGAGRRRLPGAGLGVVRTAIVCAAIYAALGAVWWWAKEGCHD